MVALTTNEFTSQISLEIVYSAVFSSVMLVLESGHYSIDYINLTNIPNAL